MGIFRKRWESYYTPKRKIPTASPDVSTTLVSKIHPSKNISLRDHTFRPASWQYYDLKRTIPPAIFLPGITNAPPIVHPSRNPRLRDSTFRPPFLDYYQPKRVLYPSQFIPPGALSAKHPRLRDNWTDQADYRYYKPRRVLPPSRVVDVSVILNRFRRLLDTKVIWWGYHKLRRVLPGGITPVPAVTVPLISKVHPSRNIKLRDGTFRHIDFEFYDLKRVTGSAAVFIPAILIAISKVHPSRNIRLRDNTFRPPWDYHQPDRTFLSVPGVIPPVPPTPRGSRWKQRLHKIRKQPMPKWFFFRDEIERLDEETLIELDEI